MSNRVLFAVLTGLLVLSASTAASARKHRRGARNPLAIRGLTGPTKNDGAKIDSKTGMEPPTPPAKVESTFVSVHSGRVENDLMLFHATPIGVTPAGIARSEELSAKPMDQRTSHFYAPPEAVNDLEVRRENDRLTLFRETQPGGGAQGLGAAMFAATTILSAHAPHLLRVVLDGPLHLGPAILDGGGLGAGIAGRGF